MKSARVGYTKCLVAVFAYNIEHRKRNQLLYQPTDDDAKDFVKDEIDTVLRDCKSLGALLQDEPDSRNRNNTGTKKVFLGSTLDIKGGKSPKNYRRMTKDVVGYDELDGFDRDIGGETGEGEGDCLSLGDTRLETSSFPKSIRGSTPRIKGLSLIEESFEAADLQFRRFLPCPHCGHMQPLLWSQIKWEADDPATAHYGCISCQAAITYDKYGEMDRRGQWRACDIQIEEGVPTIIDHGIYLDDDTLGIFRDDGEYHPPVYHIAFHIWSAYSYFLPWPKLVKEFLLANEMKKKGKIKKLKSFINVRLGETFEEEGETADENILKRHKETYVTPVPAGVMLLTAGVDIQDDRFEMEILGIAPGEELYSIDYRVVYGRMDKIEVWNILDEMLKETHEGVDGQLFNVKMACIDTGGHYTDEVYTFCERSPLRYIPIKGHSEAGKPIAKFPRKKNERGLYFTMLGTDTCKELIYEHYKTAERGPGYCHYPDKEVYNDEYFAGATAEVKMKKYRKGVPYCIWVKENTVRNEPLDCRVYAFSAGRILQQNFGVKLDRPLLAKTAPKAPPPVAAPPVEEPEPAINKVRRQVKQGRVRKPGFTKGWRK